MQCCRARLIEGVDNLDLTGGAGVIGNRGTQRITARMLNDHIGAVFDGVFVVARATFQRIGARAAFQRVIAFIAAQPVIARLAQKPVKPGIPVQRVGAITAQQRVVAIAPLRRVIAQIAQNAVIPGHATQHVMPGIAPHHVVQRIAQSVEIGIRPQRQVFNRGIQRPGQIGLHRIMTALVHRALIFVDHVAGMVDDVKVIARTAIHRILTITAAQRVIAGKAAQDFIFQKADHVGLQIVIARGAIDGRGRIG